MSVKLRKINDNTHELEMGEGTEILFSYQTPVAAFVRGVGYIATDAYHSKTTSAHINAWTGRKLPDTKRVPSELIDALLSGSKVAQDDVRNYLKKENTDAQGITG